MNAEQYFTALSPWMEVGEIQTPPSGAPGLTSTEISTPSGTSTIQNAYISVPEKVVQVTGSLWKLIYDRSRQRLYISNATANRVEVYSLASQQFLTPIPVGNSSHGLALTPDGAQLVVANSGDGTVTVVNPDNPLLPTTISLGPSGSGQPNEIVTTNNGKALVDYVGPLQIDLTTHVLTSFPDNHIYLVQSLAADQQGSTVLCGCGTVGLWNPQSGTWYFNLLQGSENGAISGDGTTIAQGNYIATPQLTIAGRIANWDFTTSGLSITGNSATLNATGSLLYMTDNGTADSFGTGLQVFDRNHGDLKEWISLTEPVSNYSLHQIALDDTGQNVYILTKSGFTMVNLPFVPMSVAHLAPNTGSALGGTAVTVRGSGFVAGSVVRLNGASVNTQFVDSQTLSIITPALPVGPIQLSVQNPDGQSYSLDNVFAAQ
jgi:DNA-binding beta-propeller fold protein YncE